MSSNTRLDISIARTIHINWETELEAVALGLQEPIDIQSHETCELGRWIHGNGMRLYRDLDAIHLLIDAHRRFHEAAQRIVLLRRQKRDGEIAVDLERVRTLSREIIFRLTEIELDTLGQQQQPSLSANPLRNFVQTLLNGPYHALPEDRNILNVSQARLVHLRWARNLKKAFRNFGRSVDLESSDRCAMGVWLKTTGLTHHHNLTEIGLLDDAHQSFHFMAERAIRAFHGKWEQHADQSYSEALDLSRKVIYLLSVIEFKLLDSKVIARESTLID
ncbi:MAG: CZB domain-containing protein [Magnetococcales bacterium]|nr:CZB domain-containing protein [Magnetococcales bacterium]